MAGSELVARGGKPDGRLGELYVGLINTGCGD